LGGHLNTVRLLLDNKADVSVNNNEPIRNAARNGHAEVVRLLLSKGADPSAENNEALKLALNNNYVEVIRLLLADERVKMSSVKSEIDAFFAKTKNIIEIYEMLKAHEKNIL
jgi:ankyrin repeat protein